WSADTRPGLLARELARAGISSAAVGTGAVIALADASGRVAHAWPAVPPLPDGGIDPAADSAGLADQVRTALATDPGLLVVDVGAVRDPAVAGGRDPVARAEQVSAVDSRIQLVLGELPPTATVVVASLADAGPAPSLQLLAATGPAGTDGRAAHPYQGRLLGGSAGRDGLAAGTDLLPTLLDALGVTPPAAADGQPLRTSGADPDPTVRLEHVVDLDQAAQAVAAATPWFLALLAATQLALYVGTVWLLRRPGGVPAGPLSRLRSLRVLRRVAVVVATVPAAALLAGFIPWWRESSPWPAAVAAVATFCLPLALIALAGPWRAAPLGPAAVAAGLTALVFAAEAVTGSPRLPGGLIGLQPLAGDRVHGLSDSMSALLGTGALLAATAAAQLLLRRGRPRAAVLAVAGTGLATVLVDTVPGWGGDGDGPLYLLPAFGVLGLLVAGRRAGLRPAVLLVVGGATLVAGAAVLDRLRPPADRTAPGRFVQAALDGGAGRILEQRAGRELSLLLEPLAWLLPVAVLFGMLVLARPQAWGAPLRSAVTRVPVLRHGLVALGLLLGIGTAVGETGLAVPATAAALLVPLLVAACVRSLELDAADRLDAAVAAARREGRTSPRGRGHRPKVAGADDLVG
ncbi:MAG TPA: hypothetical protein VFP72_04625, partial [Kineosporiaceae bacterium]|nr:hypothetical protein [Kineosporiaceae bacterium]